jgi:hypothetical protein
MIIVSVIRSGLRYFPVLTELAIEITASGGNGERTACRKHVVKRLLLDGVHMDCARIAVNKRVIIPAYILPNLAVTPITLFHLTGVWAEFTANAAILEWGEKRGDLPT